jgi:hypothetical protein
MKTLGFTAKAAGITSLALLLTTSAFADYRHQDQTYRDGNRADRGRTQTSTATTAPQNFNHDNRAGTTYNRDNNAYRNNNNNYDRATRDNSYNRGARDNNYNRDNNAYNRDARATRSYRENEHVNLSGRITSFRPENNGYRVFLEGGQGFWVPESYYRRHSRDWRIGVNISLGGIFRGGSIIVDDGAYGYPAPYPVGYYDGYVRGVVERVDYRRGVAFLRDDRSGRIIEADLRTDRYGRLDVDNLRPGDFVELSGGWVRGDIFAVGRIDSIQSGRY